MNRLTPFLTAIAAVVLMAGTSFAGDIDHGSWQEFTGMASYTDNQLAGTNMADTNVLERSPNIGINLNYEIGEIDYVPVGQTRGAINEYYGIAPAWSEPEGTLETKAYEVTPEMDLFLN